MIVVLIIVGFVGYSYYEIVNSNGQVNVSVTGSDFSAQSFNLTFTAVDIRSSNYSMWTNYSTGANTVNLVDYRTPASYSFGNISLIEGNYTMIRFNITRVTITVNGTSHNLRLLHPYASTTGNFPIPAKITTYFKLEFVLNGNINMTSYTFNPVIQVLK